MIYTKLYNSVAKKWGRHEDYHACGYAFYDHTFYDHEQLPHLLKSTAPENLYPHLLQKMNGSFSLVYHFKDQLWAAVDRLRSFPIFYAQKNNDFFLSDDAYWVQEQVGGSQRDEFSSTEFAHTGYVTGADTLDSRVKQIQAGEAVFVHNSRSETTIKTERYYTYIHHTPFSESEEELLERMDSLLVRAFERLIQSIHGRTLVVPLSGGYDSRLIVLMLKRLGYDKVIFYSYGKPGNWETAISEQVAMQLGFKWLFVPYSNPQWYRWFRTQQRKDYWHFAHALTSLPAIQSWPAFWEMTKRSLIPSGSIIVPGHGGDFMAGSHIRGELLHESPEHPVSLAKRAIKTWNYQLQPMHWRAETEKSIDHKITSQISTVPLDSPDLAVNCYEFWEWQERQSKYIANANRVYEFWGYSWRMPLWDAEIMSFWEQVPLKFRMHKTLYDRYVERAGRFLALPNAGPKSVPENRINVLRGFIRHSIHCFGLLALARRVKQIFRKMWALTPLARMQTRIKISKNYDNYPWQGLGIIPKKTYMKECAGKEIFSILVKEILGETHYLEQTHEDHV